MTDKPRCLWHADDGRCSSCKSKRIRLDVLKIEDYEICVPDRDYDACTFYKERPKVMK